MLSLFPLHYLSLLAYFLLRVVLGIICLLLARKLLLREGMRDRAMGTLLTLTGIQFVLGFYTQIASITLASLTFLGAIIPGLIPHTSRMLLFLMWAVALALFITGAGVLAFDLPL